MRVRVAHNAHCAKLPYNVFNNFRFLFFFLLYRIKSGNPGYFVAFNPDNAEVTANFSAIASLPEQLTVFHVSEKYNITGVTEK